MSADQIQSLLAHISIHTASRWIRKPSLVQAGGLNKSEHSEKSWGDH